METVTNRPYLCSSAWVLVVSALLLLGPPAWAGQVAHEAFTPSFPIHANGGTGFAGPWRQGGFNAFASGYVPLERSLCHARLRSEGGSVSGAAFGAINGAIRDLAQPLGATVYMSFLIQAQGMLHEGIFNGFFGLTLNGSLGNDLFIGKPGAGALAQYVLEHRGGFGQVPSSGSAATGGTTLLVLKAQLQPGNDLFTLYVDPAVGKAEPTNGVIKADLDLGTVSRIGIYSSGAFAVDEIRIATSYAEVLPPGDGPRNDSQGCLVEPR